MRIIEQKKSPCLVLSVAKISVWLWTTLGIILSDGETVGRITVLLHDARHSLLARVDGFLGIATLVLSLSGTDVSISRAGAFRIGKHLRVRCTLGTNSRGDASFVCRAVLHQLWLRVDTTKVRIPPLGPIQDVVHPPHIAS